MASLKRNVDHNRSVNSSFVFSLPLSPVGCENDVNTEAKVAIANRKRKAPWEADGGAAKKRRNNWDTEAKKQLFHAKTSDKMKTAKVSDKKNSSMFKTVKQTKALRKGGKRVDDRNLFSASGITYDQLGYTDFPSKSGHTHGMVKVTVSTKNHGPKYIAFPLRGGNTHGLVEVAAANKNDGPTKKDKKINWRVSIIPLQLKEAIGHAVKSLTRRSNPEKVNINNNSIPYLAASIINVVKSNRKTN